MSRDAERKNVLENVARLERENAELRVRVEHARARETLEETVRVRPSRSNSLRVAAAISAGLAFGLVTLAITLLMMPSVPRGHDLNEMRGTSAGVCR